MTASPLTLGGVVFSAMEIPDEINFGGAQMNACHKLVGGTRIVDALGRDDEDPTWSGRFVTSDSLSRAQTLDALRIAGALVDLTVSTLSYQVLITKFVWHYKTDWHIDYSITCFIVTDNSQPAQPQEPGIDDAMSGDLSTADALGAMING